MIADERTALGVAAEKGNKVKGQREKEKSTKGNHIF